MKPRAALTDWCNGLIASREARAVAAAFLAIDDMQKSVDPEPAAWYQFKTASTKSNQEQAQ